MMNSDIRKMMNFIDESYPLKTLHILSGYCMLEAFHKQKLMNEKATYVPFNEAMCWGETEEKIFSSEFVKKRSRSLKSTSKEYREIVMEPLKPLFEGGFDVVVLWFGDDMFCQMNLITVLAYLDQIDFKGDVLFCMLQEQKEEMLFGALEIDVKGYNHIYKTILCRKEKFYGEMLPVNYQAMNLYLGYKEEKSDIIRYIKKNINKESLLEELLKLFPQYGLGDLQYQWMIEELKKNY